MQSTVSDVFDLQAEGMNLFNTQPEKQLLAFLKAAKLIFKTKCPKMLASVLDSLPTFIRKISKTRFRPYIIPKALDYACNPMTL